MFTPSKRKNRPRRATIEMGQLAQLIAHAHAFQPFWSKTAPAPLHPTRSTKPLPVHGIHDDPFDLARFVSAQRGKYETALEELRNGEKRSHWMWFIFPQVAGLGSSAMAVRYAIQSRAEAKAYLAHPILGPRLLECARALLQVEKKSAAQIMGSPDDIKLRSSMTLFAEISEPNSPFHSVIDRYFSGASDVKTIQYLASTD